VQPDPSPKDVAILGAIRGGRGSVSLMQKLTPRPTAACVNVGFMKMG
jgi:hypothetical protein